MIFINKNFQKFLVFVYAFFVPIFTLYAETKFSEGGQISNPLASKGINSISGLIETFLKGALRVGIPIIALAIIYCGFLFVAARGNSEKLTKAKDALMYTLIGAAVLLGSWAIAQLISETVIGITS